MRAHTLARDNSSACASRSTLKAQVAHTPNDGDDNDVLWLCRKNHECVCVYNRRYVRQLTSLRARSHQKLGTLLMCTYALV